MIQPEIPLQLQREIAKVIQISRNLTLPRPSPPNEKRLTMMAKRPTNMLLNLRKLLTLLKLCKLFKFDKPKDSRLNQMVARNHVRQDQVLNPNREIQVLDLEAEYQQAQPHEIQETPDDRLFVPTWKCQEVDGGNELDQTLTTLKMQEDLPHSELKVLLLPRAIGLLYRFHDLRLDNANALEEHLELPMPNVMPFEKFKRSESKSNFR